MNRVVKSLPKHWVLLASLLAVSASLAQQISEQSSIGFNTVEAAYNALQSNPEAEVTHYEGWIIFKLKNNGKYMLWSFTPEQHPAHPAVIRREIVKHGDELLISMDALCEAHKLDCGNLVEQFRQLNERLRNKAKSL